MKAIIDEGCIACGLCESVCPKVFQMGDDGFAQVHGAIDDSVEKAAQEAQDGCPASVIHLVD